MKKNDVFDARHEEFLNNPENFLKEICNYLGTDAPEDYLRDCGSIVLKSHHKTRYSVKWDDGLVGVARGKKVEILFLAGYSYMD